MRAIFIAVGSELLELDRLDTNSIYISRKLRENGIRMDMKMTVGDNLENLSWTIKTACKRSQLVIITGGLGPTEDDITREATANALKRKLIFKDDIVHEIRAIFQKRGITMPNINTRQAFMIEGSEILPNSVGTAPGQYIEDKDCKIVLLPGPPREMHPMFEDIYHRKIAPASNFFIYNRCLKFAGISESETDAMISSLYRKYRNPVTTILASPGFIEIHLLGRSKKDQDENKAVTDQLAEKIKAKLSDYFITDEDITFEEFIIRQLRERNISLSVAESCTGGGLSNRITNVPGCSEVFLGGVIAYSNELKMTVLGVKKTTLEKKGAVSEQTAGEMASGIAGPGGATDGKPVGLVCMHLSSENHEEGISKVFSGNRQVIKTRSENTCLNLIRQYLQRISQ